MINEKSLSLEKATQRVQYLCARQERCTNDIRLKLRKWQISSEEIEGIIEKLIIDNFINDERYARMFARDKSKFNKWGSIKIAYALRSKNIPDEIIKSVLSEIVHDQDDKTLQTLLSKKAKTIKAKSLNDLKAKLIRFGISRGYEYGLVYNTVTLMIREE